MVLSRPLRQRLLRGCAVTFHRAHQFEDDVACWATPTGRVRLARYMRPLPPARDAKPAPSSGALPEPDKQPTGGGCSQALKEPDISFEPSTILRDPAPLRWAGPAREPESPFGIGLGTALGLGEPEDEAARYARVVTSYHKPSEDQARRIERMRLVGEQFIAGILRLAPSNADRSTAVRLARQALQNAVAAIVVPDVPMPGGSRG